MELSKIFKNQKTFNNNTSYIKLDENGKMTSIEFNVECAASISPSGSTKIDASEKKDCAIVFIPKNLWDGDVSEDLKNWCFFLNKCLLPVEFLGSNETIPWPDDAEESKNYTVKYNYRKMKGREELGKSYYAIKIPFSECKSPKHVLACNTGLRYFWSDVYEKIAELAMELKTANPRWNYLTALTMAHYGATEKYNPYRGLVCMPKATNLAHANLNNLDNKSVGNYFAGPPKRAVLKERLERTVQGNSGDSSLTVNETFTQAFTYSNEAAKEIEIALKAKDYRKIKTILYRQGVDKTVSIATTGDRW